MRFTWFIAPFLGVAAAGPCRPRPATTSLTSVSASTTAVSTGSSVSITSVSTASATSPTTSASSDVSAAVSSTSSSASTSATSSSASSLTLVNSVSSTTAVSSSSTITSSVSKTSGSQTSATSSSTSESITTATSSPGTTTSSTVTTTLSTKNPATAAVTNPVALSYYDADLADGTDGRDPPSGGYVCFAGPSVNFPPRSTWASFDTMWAVLDRDEFSHTDDTADERQSIKNAVVSVSQVAKVDPRVILAVIMVESAGRVRVGCTTSFGGVKNCGIMQAYDSSSYNAADSDNSIHLMVQDGTQGTQGGDGLVQWLNGDGNTGGDLWNSLRSYNSGSYDASNLSDGRGATTAYVSNIANYLQGWNGYGDGPTNCNFNQPFNSQPSSP